MKLVPYWRQLYKLSSVQIVALIPILGALRQNLDEVKELLPPSLYVKVSAAIAICAVLARFIPQEKVATK